MPTPTPAAAHPAVAQAADSAADDLLGGLEFQGGSAAAETPADTADTDVEAADGDGDGAGTDAGDAAEGDVAAAAEGEGAEGAEGDDAAGEAAAEGEGEGEGEGDAGKEKETPREEEKSAQPPADPKAAERAAAEAKAYAQWEADFGALEQKIADGKFDPIEDGQATTALMTKGFGYFRQAVNQLHAEQEAFRQERAAEKFWDGWGQQNAAIGATPADAALKGRKAFEEEYAAAIKKHGDPKVAVAVAEERWNARMKVAAGVAKAKPARVAQPAAAKPGAAKPATATTTAARKPAAPAQSGGRVIPPNTRAPAQRPMTYREKVEKGAYGNLSQLID